MQRLHKELKRLSKQMYAIEVLKEGNAGRSDEAVAQDLLLPLPLMTLKQFLQCENQLEVNTNMRKQFVSIFILSYLLNITLKMLVLSVRKIVFSQKFTRHLITFVIFNFLCIIKDFFYLYVLNLVFYIEHY